jgi:hypothetical protein
MYAPIRTFSPTLLMMLFGLAWSCSAHAASSIVYVSNSGNDGSSGQSVGAAKKTIQAAVDAVAAGGTVFLEPGVYTGAGNDAVSFGNPDAPVIMTVQSDPANGGGPSNTIIDLQGEDEPAFSLGEGLTSAAQVIGLTIENSDYDGGGGAISIGGGSPTIQNCVFFNNQASIGGAIIIANGSPTIRECTFSQNQALPSGFSVGGAIEIETTNEVASGTFTPIITNCVFSGNTAQTDGAAIDVSNGLQPVILDAEITNCTFSDNTSTYNDADDPGGAIGVYSANVKVTNCILYGDAVLSGGQGGEITIVPPSGAPDAVVTASFSDIQQASGTYPGSGNSSQNPMLAAGLDLAAGSPAINAGTTSVPVGVDISIDRTGRTRDSQPDLGAYEVLAPTADAQSVNVAFNTATAITLTGSDPNVTPRTLTYGYSQPANGTVSGAGSAVTYTPNAGFHGSDSFTFKVSNGTYLSASATVSLTVAQGAAATVTGISVGWGSRTALLTPSAELPWLGIKTLIVTLSQAASLSPGDISVTGKAVANYGPVAVSGSGTTYTLTLAQPIGAPDRLTVTLGNASVTTDTVDFSVLPGDISGDGVVNASDLVLARNAIGSANAAADINGDNAVTAADYSLVGQRIGNRLP